MSKQTTRERLTCVVLQKLVDAGLHVRHVDVEGLATEIVDRILGIVAPELREAYMDGYEHQGSYRDAEARALRRWPDKE